MSAGGGDPGTGAAARIRALLAGSRRAFSLAEAALLVAAAEYPDLDVVSAEAELDVHAAAVRAALAAGALDPRGPAAVEVLRRIVFDDLEFRGDVEAYYDPRNSYLNDVLERRLGIPITLAIVYCEIGRRAGLRPLPVGFPGHFLVKHEWPGETLVLDPFEGGRPLGRADLEALLAARTGLEAMFGPQHLRTAEPREVLARVLRNLKAVYLKTGDLRRALRVVGHVLLFEPQAREERRDRGLIAARLGRLDRALCDLVGYARAIPDGPERRTVRAEIDALRRRRGERN